MVCNGGATSLVLDNVLVAQLQKLNPKVPDAAKAAKLADAAKHLARASHNRAHSRCLGVSSRVEHGFRRGREDGAVVELRKAEEEFESPTANWRRCSNALVWAELPRRLNESSCAQKTN
jgi:hypothetical protein